MTPLGEHHDHHLPKDLKELGELAHLLFEWPIRQAPRLALPACILIAAILQAGMIIAFTISYSAPKEILPTSPQIYFLPPDSAAAHQLAPWLSANDPAVFSPQYDTRDALPASPPLKYRPSYEDPLPPLRSMPTEIAAPIIPPLISRQGGILQKPNYRTTMEGGHEEMPPPPTSPTVVRWQDDLANRRPTIIPQTTPQALSDSAGPSLYEVQVSPEGVPMHCILLDSSGDPASDELGSVWIHAQRFEPSALASWGRVLLLWSSSSTKNPPSQQ